MIVGVDLTQFARDPYGSGIQRVLQQLARCWPVDDLAVDFVLPTPDGYALLSAEQAERVLSVPFAPRSGDLREAVAAAVAEQDAPRVKDGDLLAIHDAWMLPEVSYLPEVLDRVEVFAACMPVVMVGYDTLPMSEPANYRFVPGGAARVSEYFRLLATVDSVVCISAYARDSILSRLRRDPALPISVAHPGGDHLDVREPAPAGRTTFLRLGTMEARKRPLEILDAFLAAVDRHGLAADLVYVGGPSASDDAINARVRSAVAAGAPVRWVEGAPDAEVHDLVHRASGFLSLGTEGYGIPVLEAIRLGTPVLYDGIQPAAELMEGRGARRVRGLDHDGLVDTFVRYGDASALDDLRGELAPGDVPTWSDFARAVAAAVREQVTA
jgi:glycosyltransferase involved in cell wall biosynthesis